MHAAASLLLPLLSLLLVAADGWLGVFLEETDPPTISEVIRDSPAWKAGLKMGDVFVAVGDQATPTRDQFVAAIRGSKPGQRVQLKVRRDGKEMLVMIRLGERPPEDAIPEPATVPVAPQPPAAPAAPRVAPPTAVAPVRPAQPVEPQDASAKPSRGFLGVSLLESDRGVLVQRVVEASPADTAGVRADDIVEKVGDRAIRTMGDLDQAMANTKPGQQISLQLRSPKGTRSVLVTLGTPDGAAGGVELQPRRPVTAPAERPAPATAPPAPPQPATDFERARAAAQQRNRPLLVVYGASWNGNSQAQRRVLTDPALADDLARCDVVYVDAATNSALLEQRGIQDLPALELLLGERSLGRHVGYLPVEGLRRLLAAARDPAVAETKPAKPARPARPAEPAPAPPPAETADPVQRELDALRQELRELRAMLEQLRRERKGRE